MNSAIGISHSAEVQAECLLAKLGELYPDAVCALSFSTPFQLLVATILSAQCTDLRVNLVTPTLFQRYPDAQALGGAQLEELEELIHSTGFYHNKARNLIGCACALQGRHAGVVPATMTELVALPGVGRKTANVVLGNVFQIPAMVVDTHVARLAMRFGWTTRRDPVQIERELCALLPPVDWTMAGHRMIAHGRALCKAPTPVCSACALIELCPRIGVNKSK